MHDLLSAHGRFCFPPPQEWPADAVRAFREITGRSTLSDVFLFDYRYVVAIYLEDAVAALLVLPVTREEWFTHTGYPAVVFEPCKIQRYSEGLRAAGYRPVVLERAAPPRLEENGKVVSITRARTPDVRRHHKWA